MDELINLARVKISKREDKIEIIPMKMVSIDRELLEEALVEVATDRWMGRLFEKWREVHDPHYAIVESNTQAMSVNIPYVAEVDVMRGGAHLRRFVILSNLTCFLKTKKSIHFCTISYERAVTRVLKSLNRAPRSGGMFPTLTK